MNEALWALGRGTGVSALVLLTLATVLGLVLGAGFRHRQLPRFALTEIHRRASLGATGLLLLHVVSLLLDPEAQLRLVDAVVPFLNARNPLWWGLGTLAVDLLLVVMISSLLRKHLRHSTWKALHWLAYALWPVALLHGIGGGTDAATPWLRLTAICCSAAVGAAAAYRLTRRRDPGPRLIGGPARSGGLSVGARVAVPRELVRTGPLTKTTTIDVERASTRTPGDPS
ncbi:ferric reductase-like transmembrane domain-containing protein [Arsenicicoccus sp. oral taxon 190]|uniref:ferric reductase-like transmembrane domain-containing protein n=1 Tax=Arsenicicoccus sp. oral taxon 190 TaxID=1658671 RepID=UPI0009E33FBF|nr:ferric reductase-like transmembrane domain-containing protein [Arsenicicoccus sp. oral taxon 190]